MVWLVTRPPEGRGKDEPVGLGWTIQQALKHSPQQIEFALQNHAEIKALTRQLARDQDVADGKLPTTTRQELEEYRREKRKQFTGSVENPVVTGPPPKKQRRKARK